MDGPEGQQLYVNAEHDEGIGVIGSSRQTYNGDVDAEVNRAIDWLRAEGIARVIVTGDFHLSTQMVGADTSEFYDALDDADSDGMADWWEIRYAGDGLDPNDPTDSGEEPDGDGWPNLKEFICGGSPGIHMVPVEPEQLGLKIFTPSL